MSYFKVVLDNNQYCFLVCTSPHEVETVKDIFESFVHHFDIKPIDYEKVKLDDMQNDENVQKSKFIFSITCSTNDFDKIHVFK